MLFEREDSGFHKIIRHGKMRSSQLCFRLVIIKAEPALAPGIRAANKRSFAGLLAGSNLDRCTAVGTDLFGKNDKEGISRQYIDP